MVYTFLSRFSLFQQWVTATLLAIVPLLLAVLFAVVSIHQQNNNQQKLRKNMEIVSIKGAEISDLVKDMVRVSRQYILLKDPSFSDLYIQKYDVLASHLQTLRLRYLKGDEQASLINVMDETAKKIGDMLQSVSTSRSEVSASLQLLIGLNGELSREMDRYRHQSLQNSENEFKRIVEQLFAIVIPTFLGTLLLMFIGITLISRPIRRLSEAIQRLASQHWDVPISIDGPSDLAALGDNLEWMRKQILASDQQKAAFVQHITHELKTPLAAIIEAGNLFHEEVSGPLTDKQHSILDVLRTNASSLEHLIQQLLNYNAVSHGIVTQFDHIEMRRLVQAICTQIESSEPEKAVSFDLKGSQDIIRTDARLLEMILVNLLRNAFQHVSVGGIITVQWGQRNHEWYLTVADNGSGLDSTLIPNIFTPFFYGESKEPRRVAKTGIGLAIVNECVNIMKGTIEVKSDIGEGATFSMSFPLPK